MTPNHPRRPNEPPAAPPAPRPSVAEMQRRLAGELSTGRRVFYTLLLCFDLAVGAVVAALLVTEAGLPPRTRLAFAGLLVVAAAWAVFFAWTLIRRKVLLARQQVIAGWLAVAFSALFVAACGALAAAVPDRRPMALLAAACGAGMAGVAAWVLVRARRRYAGLIARRARLERELASGSNAGAVALALLLAGGLLAAAAPAAAQVLGPAPVEVAVPAAPVPVPALGRLHLVYEVHLTSFGAEPVRLAGLAALDGETGAVVGAWRGGELAARLTPVGAGSGDALALAPGGRTVAYLWLALPPGAEAPSALAHRLTVEGGVVEGAAWRPDARRPARDVSGETLLENMVVELD